MTARSTSPGRRVAVDAYGQVVSQAVKNARVIGVDAVADQLAVPRMANPATWLDGQRADGRRAEFIDQLRTRTARDRTRIVIVQPHLLRATHDAARAVRQPTRDSRSLALLDLLLNGARGAIVSLGHDLEVVGSSFE